MVDLVKDILAPVGKIYSASAISEAGFRFPAAKSAAIIEYYGMAAKEMDLSENCVARIDSLPDRGKALIAVVSDGHTAVATNNLVAARNAQIDHGFKFDIYAVANAIEPDGAARPGFEYTGPEPLTPSGV